MPRLGRETRMEIFAYAFGLQDAHWLFPQIEIERVPDRSGLCGLLDIEVRDLGQGMNPGIGPASHMHTHVFTTEGSDGLFDRLLDGGSVLLPLPARETAALIFHRDFPAGHYSASPGFTEKPRRKAVPSMGLRPS